MITSVDFNGVGQGECVPVSENNCESDDDCLPGYICSFLDGYLDCVANCTKDSQCPDGYRCHEGECVLEECQNDFQCPKGTTCINGICQ